MNNKEKLRIFSACVSITLSIVKIIVVHKSENKKREQIREDARAQIEAIHVAGQIVNDKLHAGEYDGKPFKDVMSDIDFYTIAHRLEKE